MPFNADDFMNTTVNEPMSTQTIVIPEGEYLARIGIEEADITFKDGNQKKDPSKTWVQATIRWEILDESLKARLNRDRVFVRQQFFLDFNDNGQLSTEEGRNVALGQIRAAVGLNSGPFAFSQLRGAGPAMVKVTNRTDADDPEKKYADVSRVVPVR